MGGISGNPPGRQIPEMQVRVLPLAFALKRKVLRCVTGGIETAPESWPALLGGCFSPPERRNSHACAVTSNR